MNILKQSRFFRTVTLASATLILAPSLTQAEEHAAPTTIIDAMDMMQDSYRVAGRAIRKPEENLDRLLEAAHAMQKGAIAAKGMTLKPEGEVGNPVEFQMRYRLGMVKTLAALAEFEEALLMKDFDAAKTAFDKVKASKSEGHDEFRVE